MEIFIGLVVALIAFIVSNKLIIKYFQNVYTNTGMNPFSVAHQVFSALICVPNYLRTVQ